MKQQLDDLQKLIQDQTELYERLLAVLREENGLIVSSSVDALTGCNKKKEVLILHIKLHDESFAKLIEKIYYRVSGRKETPSLSALIGMLDEPYRTRLESAYSQLKRMIHEVKELNSHNERIIKGALRTIKSSISFLVSCASSGSPVYQNSGQIKTESISRPLFSKEA